MNKFTIKINTVLLLIIAVAVVIIAYRQLQPAYVVAPDGSVIDSRSGKVYRVSGNQVVSGVESLEEKLRREYPGGKTYR